MPIIVDEKISHETSIFLFCFPWIISVRGRQILNVLAVQCCNAENRGGPAPVSVTD